MVSLHFATKTALVVGILLLLASCSTKEDSEFKSQYIAYKALFIDGGRMEDTGNNNVTHSEEQS